MTTVALVHGLLNTGDLRGSTSADHLVAIDADLQIRQGDVVLYHEPAFPVVELARSLLIWLGDRDRGDFEFTSMSFEEVGTVSVRRTREGWVFSSIFPPATPSTPVDWGEVERCCREFISRVQRDVAAIGLDPGKVLS